MARSPALTLVLGLALGFVSQRSGQLGSAVMQALAATTGPWTIAAALTGRAAGSRRAPMLGGVLLVSASLAFYFAPGSAGWSSTAGFWIVGSALLGPLIATLGAAAERKDAAASVATGVLAGWLAGEGLHTAYAFSGGQRWLSVAIDIGFAAWWLARCRGPRWLLALVAVPMVAAPVIALSAVDLALDLGVR